MISGKKSDNIKSSEFSLTEDKRIADTCYFTLKGRVSANEASAMESKMMRAMEDGCTGIVVDMSQVKFFSSAGIRVVLAMYKRLKTKGGALKIKSPSDNVKNVIGMTALNQLLL